jgi:N-glycosylase/DNA lyase
MTEILVVNYNDVINNIDDLKQYYEVVKPLVKRRMQEFKSLSEHATNNDIFRELVFCILTANASAKMGLKSINALDHVIFDGSERDICNRLKGIYRFPYSRSNYIVRSRSFLIQCHNMDFHSLFAQFNGNVLDIREYLKTNVVGVGYKECSHFLRNIGFKGLAILDKHVISMLNMLGCNVNKPKNKNEYKEIEQKMKDFAVQNGFDFDELDLVFWSFKTGEIIK